MKRITTMLPNHQDGAATNRRRRKIIVTSDETPPPEADGKPLTPRECRQDKRNCCRHCKSLTQFKLTARRGHTAKKPAKMANKKWQLILLALLVGVVQVASQQLDNLLQQYARASPASLTLVTSSNSMPRPMARLEPNTADEESLDDSIESTTMNSLHSQPFLPSASLVARPSSSGQHQSACQLPPTWAGKWYQTNKEPIRVTNTEISDKGTCRDKKGDKYLFEYTKQAHQACLICLVINERHLNVLQYKESACQPVPAHYLNRTANGQLTFDTDHSLLDSICSDITGDAQLESLFRLETPPIECPISGKYHFTYDNCREPQSSVDSCIDKKQLNFKYSACPDIPGSESKSEVLKCYADWSEGNNYYMIGRLEYASNRQDLDKFRCFVYERSADGSYIQMVQSLEESCYGLINAHEDGPKTLRLTAKPPTSNKCHFPSYVRSQSENWLSVDNSLIYMFNQNSTKYQVMETREGSVIEEATCLRRFPDPPPVVHPHSSLQSHQTRSNINSQPQATAPANRRFPPSSNQFNQIDQAHQATTFQSPRLSDAVYLIQITKNWRTSGIVQIDYFIALPGNNDDQQRCRNAYTLNTPQTQIITSTNLEEQKCPFDGAYTIEAPPESDFTYNPSNIFMCPRQSWLTAQCEQPSRLKIHYKCSLAKYMAKNLKCLGSWTANGLVRLLLADDDRQRYSAWYKDYAIPYATSDEGELTTVASPGITRSQQMLALSTPPSVQHRNQLTNALAFTIDLQIALITPVQTVLKPMQVRLTRRSHCSDLRGYNNGYSSSSPASSQSSPISSYASPSASSAAPTSPTCATNPMALMLVSLLISLFFSTTSRRLIVAPK